MKATTTMQPDNEHGFKQCGADVTVHAPIVLVRRENMVVHSRVVLDALSFINAGKGLHLGNCIHIATMVSIIGGGHCVVHDFANMCAGVRIITGTDEITGTGLVGPTVPESLRSFYRSFVILKKHAFLGTNVVVHPGVTIGEGAVVASGSLVTRDLEPWGIYMGQPARRVKDRPGARMLELEQQAYAQYALTPADFTAVEATIADERSAGLLR